MYINNKWRIDALAYISFVTQD